VLQEEYCGRQSSQQEEEREAEETVNSIRPICSDISCTTEEETVESRDTESMGQWWNGLHMSLKI